MTHHRENKPACEQCQEELLACLEHPLGPQELRAFRERFAHCPACLEELSQQQAMLSLLQTHLVEAEPAPAVDQWILAMASEAIEESPAYVSEEGGWWERLLSLFATPAFKAGLSFALLALVVGGSYILTRPGLGPRRETNFSARTIAQKKSGALVQETKNAPRKSTLRAAKAPPAPALKKLDSTRGGGKTADPLDGLSLKPNRAVTGVAPAKRKARKTRRRPRARRWKRRQARRRRLQNKPRRRVRKRSRRRNRRALTKRPATPVFKRVRRLDGPSSVSRGVTLKDALPAPRLVRLAKKPRSSIAKAAPTRASGASRRIARRASRSSARGARHGGAPPPPPSALDGAPRPARAPAASQARIGRKGFGYHKKESARSSGRVREQMFRRGLRSLSRRNLGSARRWFQRYLSMTPRTRKVAALQRVLNAMRRFGHKADARRLLRQLLRADPRNRERYQRALKRLK